jgi:hypothetical protein
MTPEKRFNMIGKPSKIGLKRIPVKLIHLLLVTRGLDPRVHPLRIGMDCRSSPAMTAEERVRRDRNML